MYYKNEDGERRENVFKFHVLITTYECIITDIMDLKDISWRACVIDEAHRSVLQSRDNIFAKYYHIGLLILF